MTCKNCGTEIADKALICYRCGTPTFEAQRKPAAVGGGRRWAWLLPTLLLVVLVLVAVGVSVFQPDATAYVRWGLVVVGVLIVAARLILQRRVRR